MYNSRRTLLQKTRRFFSIAETAIRSRAINKKVIVFESDDWGSIRTPKGIKGQLDRLVPNWQKNPYHRFDILESAIDFREMIGTLSLIQQKTGKKVKFTLNYVMANPDFDPIRQSGYYDYHFELFPETYQRYWRSKEAIQLLRQGSTFGYFLPQFHGREHIQVPFWLEQLRNKDRVFLKAFELGFSGISLDVYKKPERNVQASFDVRDKSDFIYSKKSLIDGLGLFNQTFGFSSKSIIPNNYIWPSTLNSTLLDNEVKFIQGMKSHAHPRAVSEVKRTFTPRRSGGKTAEGILNLVRNTSFEPSFYTDKQAELSKCLKEIGTAFLFRQPAVISMHRINFVGGLHEKNRTENLRLFEQLACAIIRRWPDVEFWDSVQLGEYFLDRV